MSMMKPIFVFSGQGAQTVGMGKDLCDVSPAAAAVFAEADRTLDWSVSELCFQGPEEKLKESRYCQPAIYTMSCACLAAFQEKFPNVTPGGCAGLSLGEFAALHAAGVFPFADGLQLVARRGELMDKCCRETAGGMASVLGGDPAIIQECCRACDIDVANYNCPGQIVVSGEAAKVDRAVAMMKEKGLRKVIPLKVAGAYHSRLMAPAGRELGAVLDGVAMQPPKLPVAQNFTGKITAGGVTEIKNNLIHQVAGSVRWEECVLALRQLGGDALIEFGPGAVLTGLSRRIDKDLPVFNIGTAAGLAGFSVSDNVQ